jgi:hypothetical protein
MHCVIEIGVSRIKKYSKAGCRFFSSEITFFEVTMRDISIKYESKDKKSRL